MTQRDFYEVLGVAKGSDQDSIKKAYRKLAMQYHPDKNPGDKAAEDRFKEAAGAYEVLSSPDKRAKYDQYGHAAFANGGRGGGGDFQDVDDIFSNFSDIFGDLFGGSRGGRQRSRTGPAKGSDLRYISEMSLEEAAKGLEKDIEYDTEEACKPCSGSGAKPGTEPETCTTCRGSGQVVSSQGFFSLQSTCPKCQGAGRVMRDPCTTCRGRGRSKVHRKIRVTIPAGVDSGQQLRVSGEGEGGARGGPSGDLFVEIRVKDHKRYQREGLELYAIEEVDYIQALLGSETEIATIDGKATLKVPAGSNTGDRIKISQQGMPSIRNKDQRGDLVIQLDVQIPRKLSKEEEALLRQIAELRGSAVKSKKKGIFN
jgi:molecular chaperone DnaJ